MIGIFGGTGRFVRLQQARVGGLERQSVLSPPSALLGKGFFICHTWKSKECKKSELWTKCFNFSLKKTHKTGLEIGCHRTTALAVDSPVYLLIGECLEQKAPSVASYHTEASQKCQLDTTALAPLFSQKAGWASWARGSGQYFCPVQSKSSHPTSPGLSA